MSNRVRRRPRRWTRISLGSLLLLLLELVAIICVHRARLVDAASVFGRNKADKKEKEEEKKDEDADYYDKRASSLDDRKDEDDDVPHRNIQNEPSSEGQTLQEEEEEQEEDHNPSPTSSMSSSSHRPPSIIEAEARAARDLGRAVRKLSDDLDACSSRADSAEEGFRKLYATHLASVDGLRKCREGMLMEEEAAPTPPPTTTTPSPSPEQLEALEKKAQQRVDADDYDVLTTTAMMVDPDLARRAHEREGERKQQLRDEELASKQHREEVVRSLEERVDALVRRERSWERTISELQARRDLLEKREGAWERTIVDLMGEIEERARREDWWEGTRSEMEGRIGALSREAVVERFGPGPHHVSVTVLLEEGNPSSQRTLVLRLAPVDLMPHSVHLFLSQIAEGYWSRGSPAFVLSAEHVIQACPHPCLDGVDLGGRLEGYPYEDMRATGLDALSFREYSPMFPHERYTVGFAGRPRSGPEFFVNLLDNTLDHGPAEERRRRMGTDEYEAWAEEAFGGTEEEEGGAFGGEEDGPYPCFGKLVEGFEVVDEIARRMTRASLPKDDSEDGDDAEEPELDDNILLRPVKISSMEILENYRPGTRTAKEANEEESEGGSRTRSDEL